MLGKLYGVGVGPGDPELMTLKAVRIIKECPVIAIPHKEKDSCVAYRIARQTIPEIEEKILLELPMPMTKDKKILEASHNYGKTAIIEQLEKGRSVAFLTLGDAAIYSTCLYVQEKVKEEGYITEIINGIPSFCAVAAKLGGGLVNGAQQLHIIPASYQIEDAIQLSGVKVLMKAGKELEHVKEIIKKQGLQLSMVENCGMVNEKVHTSLDTIEENASYYSLFIVK